MIKFENLKNSIQGTRNYMYEQIMTFIVLNRSLFLIKHNDVMLAVYVAG